MRRPLQPPTWPPEPGADPLTVTLTIVSGPVLHPDDARFPGIFRHRLWVRWFDDRAPGTWRTHVMFSIPPMVARYWQHAGYTVRLVNAVNERLEQRCPAPVAYYRQPHHPDHGLVGQHLPARSRRHGVVSLE